MNFPTPWRVEFFGGEYWIKDANGEIVTSIAPKYPRGKDETQAASDVVDRIVRSVNATNAAAAG
jgi:hypothetical protein